MLGYDTFATSSLAARRSPAQSAAAAGAAYALLFAYVGATFASVQYSILPLLWVLLGGAGTMLGPLVGTLFMFYLVDVDQRLHLGLSADRRHRADPAGAVFPKGMLGTLRARAGRWLP